MSVSVLFDGQTENFINHLPSFVTKIPKIAPRLLNRDRLHGASATYRNGEHGEEEERERKRPKIMSITMI